MYILDHGRSQVSDAPNFTADGSVSAGHDRQRKNEDKDEHVELVDLPAERIVPVADAPKGRDANTDRQVDLYGTLRNTKNMNDLKGQRSHGPTFR